MSVKSYVDLTGLSRFLDNILVGEIVEVSNGTKTSNIEETKRAPSVAATYNYVQGEIEGMIVSSNAEPYIPSALKPVGGKIFYIDPDSTAIYQFFDINGDEIENVGVGSTPYYYLRISEGNNKDKFYVYHDELFTSKRWTYYDPVNIVEGDPRYNASYPGYAMQAIGGTSSNIGAGRTNTQIVMAKDDGAYVQENSNGYATVWYTIKQMRDNLVGGCDDWFLPSRYEVEELRKAIGFVKITTSDDPVVVPAGAVTGGSIAGTADGQVHYRDYQTTRTCYPSNTKFINNHIWSSSERSAVSSWYWYYDVQAWGSNNKTNTYGVFGVRAF